MFRRDLRLFLKCLASASIFFLLLAAVLAVAAGMMITGVEEVYTPIKVAVVDNEDSVYSRILINAVKGIDYIEDLLEVKRMDADDAEAAMKGGECLAVIVLPEGFIDAILAGEESHGTIYISSALGAHSEIVSAVARFGERILVAGQYGTFSGLDLIRVNGLSREVRSKYLDVVNINLLNEAISAGKHYFDVEIMAYWDTGMPTETYYGMCWLIMLLFLISVFFIPLFTTDLNRPFLNRISSYNIGYGEFFGGKIFLLFFFRSSIIVALLTIVGVLGMVDITALSILQALLATAFISLVGAAVTVCFGDGITCNVILAVVGMFLCGGLVPRQMLPQTLLRIGDLTPYGAAKAILASALGGNVDAAAMAVAAVYAVLSVLLLRRKFLNVQIADT